MADGKFLYYTIKDPRALVFLPTIGSLSLLFLYLMHLSLFLIFLLSYV